MNRGPHQDSFSAYKPPTRIRAFGGGQFTFDVKVSRSVRRPSPKQPGCKWLSRTDRTLCNACARVPEPNAPAERDSGRVRNS
jgi:hypothetical protein